VFSTPSETADFLDITAENEVTPWIRLRGDTSRFVTIRRVMGAEWVPEIKRVLSNQVAGDCAVANREAGFRNGVDCGVSHARHYLIKIGEGPPSPERRMSPAGTNIGPKWTGPLVDLF
jgi:hypothetical protein